MGGINSNPKNNPFGKTQWVWVRDAEQVPIGDGSGEFMPPLTTFHNFGCNGISNVFYQSVPDTFSDENYMLKMYKIAGVDLPIGYHLQFFLDENYGDDTVNDEWPVIMMS